MGNLARQKRLFLQSRLTRGTARAASSSRRRSSGRRRRRSRTSSRRRPPSSRAEQEAKAAEAAARKQLNTPEGKAAEKARLQKVQENSSLQLAKDMMGLGVTNIDKMTPVTKEDFEQFEKELAEKIGGFSSSEYYPE